MDDDYNVDIFEIVTRTNEPTKELVKRKLLTLSIFKWMLKRSNAFFNGGKT